MATRTASSKAVKVESKKVQNSRMSATSNDIPQDKRKQLIDSLNQHLADTSDLASQTKQAHWNVKGPQFIALHELYDVLYEGLEGYIDVIAERVTALGGVALGTARLAAQNSRIPEIPHGMINSLESVDLLAQRYAILVESARAAIDTSDELGDMATADLYTDLVRDLDKWIWFLEAHLAG